jgi:hypothetical protein
MNATLRVFLQRTGRPWSREGKMALDSRRGVWHYQQCHLAAGLRHAAGGM